MFSRKSKYQNFDKVESYHPCGEPIIPNSNHLKKCPVCRNMAYKKTLNKKFSPNTRNSFRKSYKPSSE